MSTSNMILREEPKRASAIHWPYMMVALLFFVSSFMAGMVVGHSNESQTIKGGTIFLSPVVGAALPINVFGRVVDAAGAVCAGMQVEWRSEPRYTTTDEQGDFLFDNVELGAHTVTVLNESGKAVGKAQVDISRDIMVDSLMLHKDGSGGYELVLSAQVIDIDLMVIMDEGAGTVELLADPSYSWTNLQNKAIEEEAEGRTEFGGGRFEGDIFQNASPGSEGENEPVNPGQGTTQPPPQNSARPGTGGQPNTPDGSGQGSEPEVPATPAPTQTVTPTPTAEPTPAVTPTPTSIPTPTPTPSTVPEETPTPSPKPSHGGGDMVRDVTISSQDDGEKKQWAADTRIDLFGKNTKLQPGSSGGYTFEVNNPNSFDVRFQLWLEDNAQDNPDDTDIPLRYRLKCGDAYVVGDESTWLDSTEIKANWVTLARQKTLNYTLEWSWPYEVDGAGDRTDTHLGATHDQPHLIKICTYFEQTEGNQ